MWQSGFLSATFLGVFSHTIINTTMCKTASRGHWSTPGALKHISVRSHSSTSQFHKICFLCTNCTQWAIQLKAPPSYEASPGSPWPCMLQPKREYVAQKDYYEWIKRAQEENAFGMTQQFRWAAAAARWEMGERPACQALSKAKSAIRVHQRTDYREEEEEEESKLRWPWLKFATMSTLPPPFLSYNWGIAAGIDGLKEGNYINSCRRQALSILNLPRGLNRASVFRSSLSLNASG